jgi:Helix-turn-helix domain
VDDSVGTRLREARRRRKLSLAEVEAATKIRCRYLQAIENDDWDQLPGDIYARAFIRTYGNLLGLDGERLAEEQRRLRGAARPGEGLPRVDPLPRRRRNRQVPSRLLAFLVSALVVAALLAIGLSTGGGSGETTTPEPEPSLGDARAVTPAAPPGHSLRLLARGEVWVCLMGTQSKPLIAGQILEPGDTAGPFRSDSFSLALGNGAVTMTVDGQQANLPEPASPIGFSVDREGTVREIPEGERPTCT